jgi:ergothioneine biosynthesis protein EgtB
MGAVPALERRVLIEWYRRNRARSKMLFDLVSDQAYYSRPIAQRHPLVFYEGHLPAFSFNTLVKRGLGRPSIDARLEALFARGIDPHDASTAAGMPGRDAQDGWPDRGVVQQFAAEADRQVIDALTHGDIERTGHPLLDRAEAAFAILEHEAMHQETLLYMWHRLPLDQKRRPADAVAPRDGPVPVQAWIQVPAGRATLGRDRASLAFGWDNERPATSVSVDRFEIERHDVTNGAFFEFVEAGGYRQPQWWRPEDWRWIQSDAVQHPLFWERRDDAWYWRGMFDMIPLPLAWPVYVSHAEARAYAAWRGARLPTEAEFQRAAYGTPSGIERAYPWGDDAPTPDRGVFDFSGWDPQPAGSHPSGRSAWGVDDLTGNGWEWTATVFAPFPGFTPIPSYPEYSADFFDDDHFVMKGASPVTAIELLRPTFRNWFRARYPYVYATFRCARDTR